MAILDMLHGATPFRALWIWAEHAPKNNAYVYFRKEFDLKAAPEKAELKIFACDRYQLFINGRAVRRGPAVGTNRTRFYDVADVSSHLVSGRNAVGIIVYNYGPGEMNHIFKGPGALIARIGITFPDAAITEVSTDSSWETLVPASRSHSTPKINKWDVGYCEVFDASAEPPGWTLAGMGPGVPGTGPGVPGTGPGVPGTGPGVPGFDERLWKPAHHLPADTATAFGELMPRPIPDLVYTSIPPVKCILSHAGGGDIKGAASLAGKKKKRAAAVFDASTGSSRPFAVFDFGRIISGRLCLHFLTKKPGGHVSVSYGEGRDLRHMDTIILPKKGVVWSSFGTRAFRYAGIAVSGNPAPVKLTSIEAEEEVFPLGDVPIVKGDQTLKAIVAVAADTLKASSRDYFIDCPGREQALYPGDVRLEALAAYNGFGNTELARHSIELFTLMQGNDGAIPAVGPLSDDIFIPDYHVQWPTIAHDYYSHTGDMETLVRWRVALSRAVAWMERELDRRSLIPHADRSGWWCFLDWADYLPRKGYSAILNIFAYEGFLSASRLARVFGNEGLAARWLNHAEAMRRSIHDTFYDTGLGLFLDIPRSSGILSHSRQVNSLAVTSGLVEGKDAMRLIDRLLKHDDIPPIQTPYLAWHYLEALMKTGRVSAAMAYMKQYWGGMIERGADCYWEMFDPSSQPAESLFQLPGGTPSRCHGWGAGVLATFIRRFVGVAPGVPGFKNVILKPAIDASMPPISVSFRLPTGDASYRLNREKNGNISLTYSLPEKVPVELMVREKLVKSLAVKNKPVYSRSGPVIIPPGVDGVQAAGDYLVLCLTTDGFSVQIKPQRR